MRCLVGMTILLAMAASLSACLPGDWPPPPPKQAATTPQPAYVIGPAKVVKTAPAGQPQGMVFAKPNLLLAKVPATQGAKPYGLDTIVFHVLEARFAKASELTPQENGGLMLYVRFNRKLKSPDVLLRNLVVSVSTIIEGKESRANNVPMVRIRPVQDWNGSVYYCGSKQALQEYTKRVDGQDIRCELTVRSGQGSFAELRSETNELLDGNNDTIPGGDFNTWFQARGETLRRTGGTIQGDAWTGWLKTK